MNTYQLMVNFLESELQEILFTYHLKEDTLEFFEYSCSMMNLPKIVKDPFHNDLILNRLHSESVESIVSKMDLQSNEKKQIEILFMNKPFILKYQCCFDTELVSVICLLKEKYKY